MFQKLKATGGRSTLSLTSELGAGGWSTPHPGWFTPREAPLRSFLHSPVTSSLLDPNIELNTLFSNTLSLWSSHIVTDQVSRPYRTRRKIKCCVSWIQRLKNCYTKGTWETWTFCVSTDFTKSRERTNRLKERGHTAGARWSDDKSVALRQRLILRVCHLSVFVRNRMNCIAVQMHLLSASLYWFLDCLLFCLRNKSITRSKALIRISFSVLTENRFLSTLRNDHCELCSGKEVTNFTARC